MSHRYTPQPTRNCYRMLAVAPPSKTSTLTLSVDLAADRKEEPDITIREDGRRLAATSPSTRVADLQLRERVSTAKEAKSCTSYTTSNCNGCSLPRRKAIHMLYHAHPDIYVYTTVQMPSANPQIRNAQSHKQIVSISTMWSHQQHHSSSSSKSSPSLPAFCTILTNTSWALPPVSADRPQTPPPVQPGTPKSTQRQPQAQSPADA